MIGYTRSSCAATCSRRLPSSGWPADLCALAQDELRLEQMTPRVAVETLPRAPSVDFPARRVVSARRATHHDAIAFEMQNRIMSTDATQQLPEAPHCTRHDIRSPLVRDFRRCRELLGVIGHHWSIPRSCLLGRTAGLGRSVLLG